MIIWMFTSLFPPYTGGAAVCADTLVQRLLARAEIERVILVTERAPGISSEGRGKLKSWRILPRRDSLAKEMRSFDLLRFVMTQAIILGSLFFIGIFARKHIVHIHGRLVYPWTGFFIRLLRIKAVVDVRDKFGNPARFRKFPRVIAASLAIESRIKEVMPAPRISLIPVAVGRSSIQDDGRVGSMEILSKEPYFLFVGTLSVQKGIPELVEAFNRYVREGGEKKLVIVGEDRMDAGFLATHNSEGIHWLGARSSLEVYRLMARADRVILPSKSEGLPRVCLEAIALRVPVVCPPGVMEFDKFCPHCVLSEVTPAAILEMLKVSRNSLSADGFPLEMIDADVCAEKTVKLYREIYGVMSP